MSLEPLASPPQRVTPEPTPSSVVLAELIRFEDLVRQRGETLLLSQWTLRLRGRGERKGGVISMLIRR